MTPPLQEPLTVMEWLTLVLTVVLTLGFLGAITSGNVEMFTSPMLRALACFSFLLWGFAYYALKERIPKAWLGLLQIAVGLGSDWYQIGKLAQDGTKTLLNDRITFIVAGLVVIGNGIGTIAKANEPTKSEGDITPQSNVPSATPSPD
jgi:hypothetical protein